MANGFVSDILQNIFCVLQNKETHTGLEQLEVNQTMTQLEFFGWTIRLIAMTT